MGCGCGKPGLVQEIALATNTFSVGGGYTLGSYPDCTSWHTGRWQGLNVFVVGRHTEQEKIFKRTDLAAASVYQRESGLDLENIPTAELCDQAVVDLYG